MVSYAAPPCLSCSDIACSGKSTQVPAFILEDQLLKGQHCKIYCTEPRRISAISLAQRVSRELGEPAGVVGTGNSLVGYAIRLESNINRRTRLAYVTNGIALRMLEGGSGQGGQGTAFDEITVCPIYHAKEMCLVVSAAYHNRRGARTHHRVRLPSHRLEVAFAPAT